MAIKRQTVFRLLTVLQRDSSSLRLSGRVRILTIVAEVSKPNL